MPPVRQTLAVPFAYQVHFTSDLFGAANPLLASVVRNGSSRFAGKVLFIVDQGVADAHPKLFERIVDYSLAHGLPMACPPLAVPGGEAAKNTREYVDQIHLTISEHGICRHSFVVAIGGGAVLDMVGYAAATAHRGVRLIRVPTTVLSQNDSGVGVKNGINAFGKKNFLGVFAPPFAVLNDFRFLETLSDRDWRSGIAEAVKVALIKDPEFFAFLEREACALAAREMPPMQTLIRRCAELHLAHIGTGGDPFETGSSRPLDFGHWSAHKLEQLSGFALRHGEAVAIGVALDSTYSYQAGLLPQAAWRRILRLLARLGFELAVPELFGSLVRDDPECLLSGLAEFREHLGGELTVMLLRRIGRAVEVHKIEDRLVLASIELLGQTMGESACTLARRKVCNQSVP